MKTKLWIGVMVLLAVAAGPVVAGGAACTGKQNAAQEASNVAKAEKEHGCTAGTQYCLNKMAAKLRDKGWVGVELDDADGAMTITRVYSSMPSTTRLASRLAMSRRVMLSRSMTAMEAD